MKIHIYILFIGILATSLYSCSDYLDTQPYSKNTVDKLYTSASGAELGLTGCYSTLNASNIQGVTNGSFVVDMPMMFNAGTDEVIKSPGLTRLGLSEIAGHTYTSQNSTLRENWFFLFAGVNRTNYLIENIDGIDMDETRKKEIKGEGHFLRGLYYFYLSLSYGALPLYESPNHSEDAQREPIEKVYELIVADLTIAYETLPEISSREGRANKWSAAGFLAKVYTYLGSCKNNNIGADLNFELNSFDWVDANNMYSNAKTITDDIISNSGLRLTEEYNYLFRETTGSWQVEESLFALQGSKSASNGNYNLLLYWQVPTGGATTLGGGYGWLRPTGELFNKYDSLDLRKAHNLVQGYKTSSSIENIEGNDYYIPEPLNAPTNNGYCVGKYRHRVPSTKTIPNKVWSDGDIILLRYADIILLNAEARFFTGDEAGARNKLREIRDRAANDGQLDIIEAAYYNSNFATELLESRSRELCFEGWRRFDLIRFGKMGEAINNLSIDVGRWNTATVINELQQNWEPYNIWYPIPKTDIELSPIEQNPGYN